MSPDCLKLKPQTCFCQLFANILDWQECLGSTGFLPVDSPWFYGVPVSLLGLSTCTLPWGMIALLLQCLCCKPAHCLHIAWPLPLICRPVAELVPFWLQQTGVSSGSFGERTTNPPVFLFSHILKYGMECWWAAANENLWKKHQQRGGTVLVLWNTFRVGGGGGRTGEFWPEK